MSWWVWNAQEAAWQSQFEELKAYVQKHGKIPLLSDPSCGSWIDNQRNIYRAWKICGSGEDTDKYKDVRNYMDEERAAKLTAVPGWKWDMRD